MFFVRTGVLVPPVLTADVDLHYKENGTQVVSEWFCTAQTNNIEEKGRGFCCQTIGSFLRTIHLLLEVPHTPSITGFVSHQTAPGHT